MCFKTHPIPNRGPLFDGCKLLNFCKHVVPTQYKRELPTDAGTCVYNRKSLVKCVRGKVQGVFSLDNFPYDRALERNCGKRPSLTGLGPRGRYLGRKEKACM
jgi:hypothetical protein